ncbi:MAG: methyl-accepting chemotaxis protein [Gemmatimonadota bacterium]|nr:methyl-accepting chemotaxis protein [Gemmatimonadota bacterium]MDH4349455.1 methyl-accepting chemotaxis protein [Gemmatimonadota bacterium]
MSGFRFRSIGRLNAAAMASAVVLVLGIAGLGVFALGVVTRQTAADIRALEEGTGYGNGLVSVVLGEIRAAGQYLLTPNPAAKADFLASGDSAYALHERLRSLPHLDQEDRRLINQIAATQANLEVTYATAHALADLGRADEARLYSVRAGSATDSLIAAVQQLSRQQTAHTGERARAIRAQAEFHQKLLFFGAFLALAVISTAAMTVTRVVDRQMTSLIAAADRFGGGDLRPLRLGAMPDELARLAEAMDRMATRLREVVETVARESSQLSGSAGDFSAMSEEIAASTGEISSAMVRITTSAGEQVQGMKQADDLLARLQGAADTNTAAAQRAVQLTEDIRRKVLAYRGDIEAARTTLLDVRGVVQTSSQQVRSLVQQSDSITAFIDLIKQISSQTNLLALNAAIEAARAGEHGRGFAVVADEVRQLADSSARAATEVTDAVEFLRGQIREIAETMQVGSGKVEGIGGVAQSVIEGLNQIGTAIGEVRTSASTLATQAELNRDIIADLAARTGPVARAASEHASSSEEVCAAAEQMSASTEDMASSASGLLESADRLSKVMAEFRTS